MKKILAAASILVSICATSAHPAEYRVLASDNSSITIEFRAGSPRISRVGEGTGERVTIRVPGFYLERVPGRRVLPVRRYLVEVPAEGRLGLTVIEAETSEIEGAVPSIWRGVPRDVPGGKEVDRDDAEQAGAVAGAGPSGFAVLVSTGTMRKKRIAMVDIYPVLPGEDGGSVHAGRVVVRLSWPAADPSAAVRPTSTPERFIIDSGRWTPRRTGISASPAQRTPFEFSLSGRWLKLGLVKTALYRISYEDLTGAGLDPQTIDPATVRIFTGGPLEQPEDLSEGGSFEEDYHLAEVAIHYVGANSGSMMPGEYFVFFGLGVAGWKDDVDPFAEGAGYYKHRYSDRNYYWMSWEGSFPGRPRRMQARGTAPSGSPDAVIDRYVHRIHREDDRQYDPIHTDDHWAWRRLNTGTTSWTDEFECTAVAGGAGTVRTYGYGPYVFGKNTNSAECLVNGTSAGGMSWTVFSKYDPDTLVAPVTGLAAGKNTFRLSKPIDDVIYVIEYDIFYDRYLAAEGGSLDFRLSDVPGSAEMSLSGFPAAEEILLLDVTGSSDPVVLSGWQETAGGLVFEDSPGPGPVHYHAAVPSAMMKPEITIESLAQGVLPSLRDETGEPGMVIVYHRSFRRAALRLAAHRSDNLPGPGSDLVRAVDVEDVYNNFSGGLKDPAAIRNYLKFLYDTNLDNGSPVLRYVLLMGNCTYDAKDILDRGNDYVPIYINTSYGNEGVEEDDFLVRLDSPGDALIDIALGRMTVLSAAEADDWVDRIIRYESDIDLGTWRNRFVVVADDEHSTNTDNDFYFQEDAEWMIGDAGVFPAFADFRKIYLHHYPFVGDLKPGARSDLIEEWSAGALVVNYAGHGSPQQLADERVMQMSDVYSLSNGNRQPLFLAFSCTVGDLESPYHRSMGQEMMVLGEGGAIAGIVGVAPTTLIPNRDLNYIYLDYLFADKDSTYTIPVGTALQLSKVDPVTDQYFSNNSKYTLLGDPAMTLALPRHTIEHDISAADTMLTGRRYSVEGSLISGGAPMTSFNGTAGVVVEESRNVVRDNVVWWGSPFVLEYWLPGKEIFRGTVDVTGGRFSVEYVVPMRCRTGDRARIRSYVYSTGIDGIGAVDTLDIKTSSTAPPNEGPPRVDLYFAGQATKVKKGARLIADIYDDDGIAILGADPQSSIFLEFDGSGYPIFVTEYFEYEHGSYRAGRVEYPLHSGFEPGEHTVVMRAFDNLGESAADTLEFEVVEEGLYTVSDVFNMPNPFRDSTNFVFQLSGRASVTLRVYNLSGVEIYSADASGEEGFNSIWWDGRDSAGDRVANGTYIYVLEVDFADSYNRSETVTGKVVLLR